MVALKFLPNELICLTENILIKRKPRPLDESHLLKIPKVY